jgi:coenzyme F420-0:L-glutamate ligase/coenzyme F420-1:gamma-L-glutamate ligase
MSTRMVFTALPGLPLVQPGDDLATLVLEGLQRADLTLQPGDVLGVAQKIVSKSEGRLRDLRQVTPSPEALELAEKSQKDARVVELLLGESRQVLRTRPGLIVVEHKLGFICANAGIDHSNVKGAAPGEWVLLLPADPDASAARLRKRLADQSGVGCGVVIVDSHGRAWRHGTVGAAIGLAGLPGLLDLRGCPDLFGRTLRVTQVGLADEIAAAASLLLGQADEATPVVHIRGVPHATGTGTMREIIRPEEEDLFR